MSSVQANDSEVTPLDSFGGRQAANQRKYCNPSMLRLLGACLCIIAAVATWVIMAEKLQGLSKTYNKPYFLSYWVHSFYSTLYIVWVCWRWFPGNFSCNRAGDGTLTKFRPLFLASGLEAVVSIVSAYMWYLSLTRTNIPANTAIYQSASAIVFVLSVPLLKERVTLTKVMCVVVSIGGVTLVAIYSTNSKCGKHSSNNTHHHNSTHSHTLPHNDDCQEKSTVLGYVFLAITVILYALFEVLYKRLATRKDDTAPVMNGVRFLGYMGVHTLLWLWPLLIVFHFTGVEVFELPSLDNIGLMTLNAFFDVIFNASLLVCIALSSPLFASVGTILAIPTSVVVDLLVQRYVLPWQAGIGIALIAVGFGGFVLSEYVATRREAKHELLEGRKKLKLSVSESYYSNDTETSALLWRNKKRDRWRKIVTYLI